MSEHIAEVVEVRLEKLENADSLSVARIRGWQVVVRTDDFKGVMLGVYIPLDCVVPDTPEWSWLSERRIKTHKFRGAISQGLLIPAKRGMSLGEDVTAQLGITKYIPKTPGNRSGLRSGQTMAPPPGMVRYTDIENWKNYTDVFKESDMVAVTEKIHGANARFALLDGKFYVASLNTVRMPIPPEPASWLGKKWITLKRKLEIEPSIRKLDTWQRVADEYEIERKLRHEFGDKTDVILFGEMYGPSVQKLDYGVPAGEVRVAFFDILINGAYDSWFSLRRRLFAMSLPSVPLLGVMTFGFNALAMADGKAFAGNHVREGIVIRPNLEEEYHPKLGRKILKVVSEKYLLKDYEDQPEE